jgi:hypothetical protein
MTLDKYSLRLRENAILVFREIKQFKRWLNLYKKSTKGISKSAIFFPPKTSSFATPKNVLGEKEDHLQEFQ